VFSRVCARRGLVNVWEGLRAADVPLVLLFVALFHGGILAFFVLALRLLLFLELLLLLLMLRLLMPLLQRRPYQR
jgi:hypothetical protein